MPAKNKTIEEIINYIKGLDDFLVYSNVRCPYEHMGATLTDTILQAGLNYNSVVFPRVMKIKNSYPEAATTVGFLDLLKDKGPNKVLDWQHDEKPFRLLNITKFFMAEEVLYEEDLRTWFLTEGNKSLLLNQRGIGPKTIDYLQILIGIQTIAVDRHLVHFFELAGVQGLSYEEIRVVALEVAGWMETDPASFDYSVWDYMSKKNGKSPAQKELF